MRTPAPRAGQRHRRIRDSAFSACIALLLSACSGTIPDLAGTWKSERTTLTITQDRSSYKIVADNPRGILGGNHGGQFHDGRLELTGPLARLCGDMKYDEKTHILNFCGEEFVRVPK